MAYYDDPEYEYTQFWQSREYEHQGELIALEKLLGSKNFPVSVDVGGGFGRLTKWLAHRSKKVYLVEPSTKMRQIAKKKLASQSKIVVRSGEAANTNLPAKFADLVVMVRVMHHLPHPKTVIVELNRILKPHGLLVIEFANSLHFLARLKSIVFGKPIIPGTVERRSEKNISAGSIPFLNHHPLTVKKLLVQHGFKLVEVLSVSNFRHPLIKKIVHGKLLLGLESRSQRLLSSLYFGPSIFILAKKS